MWRLWAKSLGEKPSKCDNESDKIAIIRTIIFFTYLITNIAIVSNAVRHWNSNTKTIINNYYYEIPSRLSTPYY